MASQCERVPLGSTSCGSALPELLSTSGGEGMECSVSRKWDCMGLYNHQPPNLPELHERCSTREWDCKGEKRKRRRNRAERMKEGWKGRPGRWVGTLTCSHMLFTVVSYDGLYFRCAFGYNGVNCEDSEYKSLASLLNTWKTLITFRIQSSSSKSLAPFVKREKICLQFVFSIWPFHPSHPWVTGSSALVTELPELSLGGGLVPQTSPKSAQGVLMFCSFPTLG